MSWKCEICGMKCSISNEFENNNECIMLNEEEKIITCRIGAYDQENCSNCNTDPNETALPCNIIIEKV